MSEKIGKLTVREKLGYGFGDLASVLYWQTFMAYLLFFYTDIFGIAAAVAGTMILFTRIWDGIFDPMMGMIADRTHTRWGKYRPYLLWIAVPFVIVGVLTFTTPDLNITGKIIYAVVTFTLLMMLYTAINIPYSSILGVITSNPKERTSVSSYKFIFAYISGTIVSVTLLLMVDAVGRDNQSIVHVSQDQSVLTIEEKGLGTAKVKVFAQNVFGDSVGQKTKTEFNFRINPEESNLPILKTPVAPVFLNQGFQVKEIDISDVFTLTIPKDILYQITAANKDTSVVKARVEGSKIILVEKGPGKIQLTLKAEDKKWGFTENTFPVYVNATGNHIPVCSGPVPEIRLKEAFNSHQLDLSGYFNDPDNDRLNFSAESDNSQSVSPNVRDSVLSFLERKSGLANVTIRAYDGNGGEAVQQVRIIVAASKNNPPFKNNPVPNISLKKGFGTQSIDLKEIFMDTEGDQIRYSSDVVNYSKGWQRSFMIYGAAALIFFLITFVSVRERVQPPKAQKTSIKKDLADLFSNKPWVMLLFTTLLFILFVATRMSVTAHYFKYYVGEHQVQLMGKTFNLGFAELVSAFNAVGQIFSVLGVVFIAWFAKIIGKRKNFIYFFIVACIATGAYYFLKPDDLFLIFFFQIIGSFTGGPLSPLIWAMYADAADYSEYKTGRRATGLVFSASTMSQKFGWAIGAAVVGWLLSYFGFRANELNSPQVLNGIKALMSTIPVGAGILAIIVMLFYKLDEKEMKEIETELLKRRSKEA